MEMNELKPCPFCGGNKISSYLVDWKDGGKYYKPNWAIGCLECGAGFNDIFESKEHAIDRWNQRTVYKIEQAVQWE